MKDYKEKLESAKEWYKIAKEQNNQWAIEIFEKNFPELKENEDEKIVKEIIEYLITKYEDPNAIRHDYKKWISWLESWLKKQKPTVNSIWYDNMDDLIADALIKEIEESDMEKSAKHNRIYWITKHRMNQYKWSEEDNTMLQRAIYYTNYYQTKYAGTKESEECMGWLKSLKERCIYQSKRELSEEDKLMIKDAIHWIQEFQKSDRCKDENDMQNSVTCENWLKSILGI